MMVILKQTSALEIKAFLGYAPLLFSLSTPKLDGILYARSTLILYSVAGYS